MTTEGIELSSKLIEAATPFGAGLTIQPLTQRSMFWRPTYLEPSAWLEHIPFAFWLMEAHQPKVFVELGVHHGTSYFAFCQAGDRLGIDTRCYAIDTWKGDEHAGLYDESVFEKVKAHNDALYSGFSRLVRSTFDDAITHFEDGSIDLLHIDGLHTFEAVQHDFEAWLPKLSRRAVVVMHDTNVRERKFGVFKFFESLRGQYPHFEFVHGHGLGVLGVGPEQGHSMLHLFKTSAVDQARQAIHEVFARLGRACADSLVAATQQERAKILASEVDKHKKQLDGLKQSIEETKIDLASRAKELNETKGKLQTQLEQHAVERGQFAERISLLQELRVELKEEVSQLRLRIESTSNGLIEKSHQLAALTRQANEHQQQIDAADECVKSRDRSIAELTEKLNGGVAQEQLLNQMLVQLKTSYAASSVEVERLTRLLTDQADEAQQKYLTLHQEFVGRESELAALKCAHEERIVRTEQLKQALSEQTQRLGTALSKIQLCDKEIDDLRKQMSAQATQYETIQAELAMLRSGHAQLISEKQNLIAEMKSQSGNAQLEKNAVILRLEAENKVLKTEKQNLAKKLEERFRELATLTMMLEQRDQAEIGKTRELESQKLKLKEVKESISWRVTAPIRALRRLFKRLSKAERSLQKQIYLINRSGLFDKHWYLSEYPDVMNSGVDPLRHFLLYGAAEGRNPGLGFDTKWYMAENPDVVSNNINPLVHYVRHGRAEGRRPLPQKN